MQKQENNKKLEVAVIRMKELQDRRNKSAIELHDKRKLDVVCHVWQCSSVFEQRKSSRTVVFASIRLRLVFYLLNILFQPDDP
jgi:hypothetical protein